MPRIFISHSSKDAFTTAVRDLVFNRLQAIPGIEPLLDVQCIEPAEEWRPKLLRWLGLCQGAVILFSRAALASPWIFTEATVLTWRRSQNPRLLLVPALLGDVQSNETRLDAFKPVKLQEIQFVKLDSVEQTQENAEKLAEKIVACFQGFTYNETDPALTKWLEDVQVCLEAAIRQGVPDLLREQYKGMTFLLLSGSDFPQQRPAQLPTLELIEPKLDAAEEQDAIFRIEDLRNLIEPASKGGDQSDA